MTYDAKATTRAMLDRIIAEMDFIPTDELQDPDDWPTACYFDAERADDGDNEDDED